MTKRLAPRARPNAHPELFDVEYRNGIPGLLHRESGRWLPQVSGGDGPDDDPTPAPIPQPAPVPTPPAPPTPPPAPPTPAPGISQDEVNRIAAKEKDAGKRAAKQELLEALGVTKIEDAKTVLDAVRAADDAQKTEAQRAVDAANAEKAAAAEERRTIAVERLSLSANEALMAAGITDAGQRSELVPLVAAKVTGDVDVTAAVEQVKAKFPVLFTAPAATPLPPSGDPRNATPPAQAATDAWTAGKQRAEAVNASVTEFDPYKLRL